MSSDFQPYLIKDSRIGNITDNVNYGVFSGASQNNYQSFPATATSTSQLSFNVNIPSENTILDRNILIGATYKFTITVPDLKNTEIICRYGFTEAFQAFPLNSSIVSMNATINNTSVSINSQDVLPVLLKMINQRDLQKYQGLTPTQVDTWGISRDGTYYSRTANANSIENAVNPLSSINNYSPDGILPRGAFPINSITTTVASKKLTAGADGSASFTITAQFVEPLFISPFLFGGKADFNNQGLVGINTLNLNINIDTTLKRFYSRGTLPARAYTITLNEITDARLMLNFLTTQPTDLIKAKNVVPFMDFPRYITGTANTNKISASTGTTISKGTIISQNIQLNQIPDLFLIVARKPMSSQTPSDPTYFLPIETCSVNFNNASGLLSSATQYQLYEMSRDNGVQQSWLEWSGRGHNFDTTFLDTDLTTVSNTLPFSMLGAGSVLAINPSKDLSLPSYLSNGSIGQYNLQLTVSVFNYTSNEIQPELVVICCNSGVFSTIAGSSAIYTGLLTKQLVLDTQQSQSSVSSSQVGRLVGGSLSDMISTGMKYLPVVSKAIDIATGNKGGAMSAGRKLDTLVM